MEKQLWLRCIASKGQFSSELAISIKDFRGEEFSLFAERESVEPEGDPDIRPVPALLRVRLLDQEGELVLIRLPAETFNNGYTVTVKQDQLAEHFQREPA
jgi:hypothetical protein